MLWLQYKCKYTLIKVKKYEWPVTAWRHSDIFEMSRMRQPYSSNNLKVNMDRFYNFIFRPEAGGYERSL